MRKSAVWIAVVVVLVAAAPGCAVSTTTVAGTGMAAPIEPATGNGGPAVRDGGLEFKVSDLSQTYQVGDPKDSGLSVTARGIFVVVTLSIDNVGSAPVTFLDRDQELIDNSGHAFSPSMAADIYGNPGIQSTMIGPGDGLVVHIAFDVPVGTVPGNLLLRGSSASDGVTVAIS